MKRLLPLVAALLLLLLPSCMRWTLGENLRSCTEWHVGVDVAYQYAAGKEIVVPECRYRYSNDLVFIPTEAKHPKNRGFQYTGRYRALKGREKELREVDVWTLRLVSDFQPEPCSRSSIEVASADGGPSRPSDYFKIVPVRDAQGEELIEYSWAHPLVYWCSFLPLDCILDPALSIACTPFAAIWMLIVPGYF